MQNHTDTFRPSDNGQGPDAKELFGFVSGLFLLFVMTMSNPWLLLVRKIGTVGTRATWLEYGLANIVLLALAQSFPLPNYYLFIGTLVVMPVFFFSHIFATLNAKEHVHTHCLGTPRLGSEFMEFVVGAAIGLTIVLLCPVAAPYGWYVFTCVAALAIRGMMLEERDRLRSVQMDDALWEQDYMMKNYERFKKEQS